MLGQKLTRFAKLYWLRKYTMPLIFWIIAVPVFFYVLMEAFPLVTLSWIAEARRRFRSYLVNRYGRKMARDFIEELRLKYAKQGYDMKHLDKQIEKLKPMIVEKLGTRYANDFLGEPSIFEKEF